MRDIILVDGCGRPKIHEVPDGVLPQEIVYPAPHSTPQHPAFVTFELIWQDDGPEIGPEKRPIYRLAGFSHPPMRLEPDYLRKQTINKTQLRIEAPKKPHQGNCE